MAKLNGQLLLTKNQARDIGKGRPVKIKREGKWLMIGVKNGLISKIDAKIRRLRAQKSEALKQQKKEKEKSPEIEYQQRLKEGNDVS